MSDDTARRDILARVRTLYHDAYRAGLYEACVGLEDADHALTGKEVVGKEPEEYAVIRSLRAERYALLAACERFVEYKDAREQLEHLPGGTSEDDRLNAICRKFEEQVVEAIAQATA